MSSIAQIIDPKPKDLGGFSVRRLLPIVGRRHVGPLVFFDHMGPARFAPGQGIDVRPHPHIGLATVTWLFEGELTHRDTTGAVQSIRPGDVNLMTAGRGVCHSERTGVDVRAAGHVVHGIQTWVASPAAFADIEPRFQHVPKALVPTFADGGVSGVVIIGEAFGLKSPTEALSPQLYLQLDFSPGARFAPPVATERAAYVVSGAVLVDGQAIEAGRMVVFEAPLADVVLTGGPDGARVMWIAGDPHPAPRFMDWNFVSHSKDRIEAAKADWTASAAGGWVGTPYTLPAGETEFIPLPPH